MKNNTDEEKFIELRAKGLSFSKISQEIDVSRPVLIKWNNELKNEIANRSFFDSEELLEKYHLMRSSHNFLDSGSANSNISDTLQASASDAHNK